jgi:hypothetical protein
MDALKAGLVSVDPGTMGSGTAACCRRIVVHLGGQMTCTGTECDEVAPGLNGHSMFVSACRICYPSSEPSDRWSIGSIPRADEARHSHRYGS